MIQSYRAEIQNIDNGSEAMLASMHGDRVGVLELDDIRTISAASSETVEQPLAEIATSQPDKAVLLTGSTGALGSYMLDALLEGGTRRVYCFNRSANSQSLQTARNQCRGLSSKLLDSHVTFLTGDLALPYFGLPMSQFRDLQNSVTHVMHNAWPVDFNKPLQSYVKSLDGVVNLVRFCHHSPRNAMLQFVSSITSVARYSESSTIPEHAITQARISAPMGYGQSKYIAEMILADASRDLGICTISARVGQISGDASRKRGWSLHEWFPSLVVSSLHMGVFPSSLGHMEDVEGIRWVPIDAAAKILLEILDRRQTPGTNNTFHILHPQPTPLSQLLSTVKRVLDRAAADRGRSPIEVVPYHEWVSMLEARCSMETISAEGFAANPAMKLLTFFKSSLSGEGRIGAFELKQSMAASDTMRSLNSMNMDCLEAWIEGWLSEADLFFLFSLE
jgi:thioester reductase-like protein